MRLLSLYMQAQGLGYSTVLANRAGGQSTVQDLIKTSPQGATAFPVKRKIILNLLCSISLNWIIQGCACAPTGNCEQAHPKVWFIGHNSVENFDWGLSREGEGE